MDPRKYIDFEVVQELAQRLGSRAVFSESDEELSPSANSTSSDELFALENALVSNAQVDLWRGPFIAVCPVEAIGSQFLEPPQLEVDESSATTGWTFTEEEIQELKGSITVVSDINRCQEAAQSGRV